MIHEIPRILGNAPAESDQVQYMLNHLEQFLQSNLVEFLGHQEVIDLLIKYQFDQADQDQANYFKNKADDYSNHAEALSRLTAVLRSLLATGASIKALQSIMECVERNADEKDLSNLINEVRLLPDVRQDLPGRQGATQTWVLGAEIETVFEGAIQNEGGLALLAMTAENVQDTLSAVRNKLRNEKGERIIVVNPSLRQMVQQLLVLEFPVISVISQDEVIDGTGSWLKNIDEIHLSEPG